MLAYLDELFEMKPAQYKELWTKVK